MNLSHPVIQTIIAVLALCISIIAATFAWQQVEISRVHNKLSVTPLLYITPYAEGKSGRNGLYVSNVGLGPAIINNFSVKAEGVVASGFESDRWPEILTALHINPTCFATGWPKRQSAVKAGDELLLLNITKADGADACFTEIIKLIGGKGVELTIGYESIYGDKKLVSENSKINSTSVQRLHQQLFGK